MPVTEGSRYKLNGDEIAAETIAGEAVILNLSSGVYYSLDGAGGLAWTLLERGHTPAEASARVADRYGADQAAVDADIDALLDALLEAGLLLDDDAAVAAEVADDELPPAGEYVKPSLRAYTDMGDLLALDPPMPGLKEVPWRAPGG